MPPKYKTFSDALTALPVEPQAANDNKPVKQRKVPPARYRGTLPALRWLYDNHPKMAGAVADAVQSLTSTTWSADAIDNNQEIRPTVGELVKAAKDVDTGEWISPRADKTDRNDICVRLGALKFVRGELVEYGETKKGRKLQPRDRVASREEAPGKSRNLHMYVFRTNSTTPSPMHVDGFQHPISDEPALAPMYAPQNGVEAARAVLVSFGVDGSVPFEDLPFPATRCPTVIAKGAEFLGGIVGSSGMSSSGSVMWETPEVETGDARKVIEEIAAGASLKEIGERMGYESNYAIEVGKTALMDAAMVLVAANDNIREKIRRAI